jgi:ribosome-associated protein
MNPSPRRVLIKANEVEMTAVRSQGAGGQNVNKVSSAAHLRFDVHASSLPPEVQARLLQMDDRRIGSDGVVVIKAQTHRSLPRNQADALARLQALVDAASHVEPPRLPTKPTRASKRRRLQGKAQRGELKATRQRVLD